MFGQTSLEGEGLDRLSRGRYNYRNVLVKTNNMIKDFRTRKEREKSLLFDLGPKTLDELFDNIEQDIDMVLKGEPPAGFKETTIRKLNALR
jgi:hypothetical protein